MPYCVYMHISPEDKVYIGITCKKPCERWRNGKAYRKNEHFYRAIEKYGWDNFKHIILFENLSQSEAYERETQLISEYKSTDQNFGYNHHKGGKGSNPGNIQLEESKRKRSIAMKGKFAGRYVGGKSSRAKKVNQYSIDGDFLKTWDSTTDVQRELGIHYTTIVKCCTGNMLTSGGFIWQYYDGTNSVEKIVEKIKTPKHHTQDQKDSISKSMMGKKHPTISKPIIAMNVKTGEVRFYESISETQKDGFCPQNVSKCLSPKYPHSKSLKGFVFEFAEAEDKRLNERIKALENKSA